MTSAPVTTSDAPLKTPVHVGFDQPRYVVDPIGGAFRIRIQLSPVPADGIVSYGVTLKFDANAFDPGKPFIELPNGLDFNAFEGAGAVQASGPGFVAVKGTVDFLGQAVLRYDSPLLATFVLTPKDPVAGSSSPLALAPFYTAGPLESVFVTGDGVVLDHDLIFDSAVVEFVPEPGGAWVLALGGVVLWLRSTAGLGRRGGTATRRASAAIPTYSMGVRLE